MTQAGAVVKPQHYLNRITPHFGLHSILEGLLRSAGISVFLVLCTAAENCICYNDFTNSYFHLQGSIHYPILVLGALL